MTQTIELHRNGLNILEIGSKVDQTTCPFLSPIETYVSEKKNIFIDHADGGKFYYLNSIFISTQSIGVLDDLFVFVDAAGILKSICIYLKEEARELQETLTKVFGQQLLSSESGIGNVMTGTKKFWSKNGLNIFCSKRTNLQGTEILIYESKDEKRYSILVVNNN